MILSYNNHKGGKKMVESVEGKQDGRSERKKRDTDGKKSITFVYRDAGGGISLGKHKTKNFSVDEAWKEFQEKHNLSDGEQCFGAIRGHIEYMKNKIRKPTRTELLKLAGFTDDE